MVKKSNSRAITSTTFGRGYISESCSIARQKMKDTIARIALPIISFFSSFIETSYDSLAKLFISFQFSSLVFLLKFQWEKAEKQKAS